MGYLTYDDEKNFGPEILDLIQRGAAQVVAPHLNALEQDNNELRQRLAQETKRNLDAALDRAVPSWREINADSRWYEWLQGQHVYSGYSGQQLLNDAVEKGDARRVIALFRGFLTAAGQAPANPAPQRTSQRTRRAPSGLPIYDRSEITEMAARRRKGLINDADWAAWEREIVAAGRDGRIRGALNADGVPMSR